MEIRISVRALVEFILRCGDIDNRKAASSDNAMQEGSRIHRMIQKRMGSDYHAEVPLSYTYHADTYDVIIEGRADGIIGPLEELKDGTLTEELFTVDEIKGTYRDILRMEEPVPVHLAQAKCYAFMLAMEVRNVRSSEEALKKETMAVRMTYCNLDTEQIRYFDFTYRYDELEEWFSSVMLEYKKWADFQIQWKEKRQQSIRQLSFPYEYRKGQKELITHVYHTLYRRKKLFIEAPTGSGKTLATVFPAVKAMGEDLAEKIFYMTAKTITRTVAENAFAILREHGLSFKTVILTAKEKICFQEECLCNPVDCPYARGHFDRINDAIYDLLTHEESFTREKIEAYARDHQVCPFEMTLDMSLFSDGVICDYNYVFDPHVYLRRFFAEGVQNDYIFLVDEAHNLVDRGREMYSAALFKEQFLELKKAVKVYDKGMGTALERCNREFLKLKKTGDILNLFSVTDISALVGQLDLLFNRISTYLEKHDDSPVRDEILDFFFELSSFLEIYDKLDDHYVIYGELQSDGGYMVRLFCVDPSRNLEECMGRGRSTVLFSATLLPIQYYKKLLGGDEEDYEVYADTVFDRQRRKLLIASEVTSKYTRRGIEEYRKIAAYILEIVQAKQGNYMVFFPSHLFLRSVLIAFRDLVSLQEEETVTEDGSLEILIQEDYMNETAREEFLDRFNKNTNIDLISQIDFPISEEPDSREHGCVENRDPDTLIGFCVMGGIFSEGIDLRNDSLIGAILVGTGLPQVNHEQDLIKDYFEQREPGMGFDYAYQYPGMNKVQQAAGRVIRTAEDVGVVALLDERFLNRSYQRLFPREWKEYDVVTCENVGGKLADFWEKWKE
ncbi:MAG: ATP-dependent DNA helicase [Lachnospiraceae bacterium]|nr:ATP-dependent DNA helicase [Lachnospiraceae bacterium]